MKRKYSFLILSNLLLSTLAFSSLTSCSSNEVVDSLKTITTDKEEINIAIDEKDTFKITTDPIDYDLSKLKFTYDESIISFDKDKLEIKGLQKGETDLVISGGKKISTTIHIKVGDILATSIDSSFSRKIIGINEEIQINVTFSPSNITNKELRFISSNTSVLSVSETGLVKGLTSGTSTLTISYPANSNVSDLVYEVKVSNKEYEVKNDKYLGEVGVARINEIKDVNKGNFSYTIKTKNIEEKTFTNSFSAYDDHIYNNIKDFNNESYTLYYGNDNKYLYTVKNTTDDSNKNYQKIGDYTGEISLNSANKMTGLMAFYAETYYTKYSYGFGEFLQNEILDAKFLNSSNAPFTSITASEDKVTLALNKKSTTTKETYRLTINFENHNFKEVVYDYNAYNSSDLDDDFNVINNAKPYEYYKINLNYEIGEKGKEDNPKIDYNNFYYTDFEVTFRNNATGETGTNFYVGDAVVFSVNQFTPSDASTSIDRVNIISSSNEDVLRVAENKLCLMADSAGESVITLQSKNVTKTYTLKVNYREATGIKFSSDFKETMASNETMNFKVNVDPTGAYDDLVVTLSEESNKYATLNKNSYGYYVLKPIKEAITETVKVTLLITSESHPTLNTSKEVTIIQELTDAQIRNILTSNTFVGTSIYGSSYLNKIVVTFKEEATTNTGVVNIYSSATTIYDSFNFQYTISRGKINLIGTGYSNKGYFNDLSIVLDNKDISSFKVSFIYEDEYEGDETYAYRCYKETI
ncbi:MAG: Ig-like domain-containing protein [Mollicutes bacterium]|nr:Ig-like domain-containing protein [Mollicutes bacterium]MDD7264117.1 Ig-like domain-containing protein [bacterium]MDY4979123.1 Ig-like domain-containing protein [Candidatus Onthovivens sp.]